MADSSHLEKLKQGPEAWNRWRQENPDVEPDLSGAKLIDYDLSRANLDGADLQRADLSKAQLSHASLCRANLESATLILADLLGAVLNHATLKNASFFGAFLFGTRLRGADLEGANLLGASLMGADLSSANLRSAHLMSANFHEANLEGADLSEADLTAASLVETRVEGSCFEDCIVHGVALWNLQGRPRRERNLRVSARTEIPAWVNGLEHAQVANLIVYQNQVRRYFGPRALRFGVVLGWFRGRGEVLDTVARVTSDHDCLPLIVDLSGLSSSRQVEHFLEKVVPFAQFVLFHIEEERSPGVLLSWLGGNSDVPAFPLVEGRGRENAISGLLTGDGEVFGYRDQNELSSVLEEIFERRIEGLLQRES